MGESAEPAVALPEPGSVANVGSFNAVGNACKKVLRRAKALKLLAAMEQSGAGPSVGSYSAPIISCEKGRHLAKSLVQLVNWSSVMRSRTSSAPTP